MADVKALCRRAVIINQGQLVYDGSLSDVNRVLGDRRLLSVKLSEPVKAESLRRFGRVREQEETRAVLELSGSRVRETIGAMFAELPVEDFTVTEVPLEESISIFYRKEAAMP